MTFLALKCHTCVFSAQIQNEKCSQNEKHNSEMLNYSFEISLKSKLKFDQKLCTNKMISTCLNGKNL
jgi:hypothetical protein